VLSKRFSNDSRGTISLNKIQKHYKNQLEDKISTKYYSFKRTNCIVCESEDFQLLSEKDRYGLPMSVVICNEVIK